MAGAYFTQGEPEVIVDDGRVNGSLLRKTRERRDAPDDQDVCFKVDFALVEAAAAGFTAGATGFLTCGVRCGCAGVSQTGTDWPSLDFLRFDDRAIPSSGECWAR